MKLALNKPGLKAYSSFWHIGGTGRSPTWKAISLERYLDATRANKAWRMAWLFVGG
ncbi:MAG TPA: hypothetical protein VKR32_08605 [Puia sp.]|nr:hypothetical protein [Puia sp.]